MEIKRTYLFPLMLLLVAIFLPKRAMGALTPEQVVQKAASVITDTKGLSVSFTLSASGHSTKGTIKSSGKKFAVILPEVSSWYNGKDLYTYNPRTAETTIVAPTAQELLEANPLLYVNGGAGNYTYAFAGEKAAGKYIVILTPRSRKSGIRSLKVTVNAGTFHPEKIEVNAGGGTTLVNITSVKTGVSLPASDFDYPKSAYPKAEIVDLR